MPQIIFPYFKITNLEITNKYRSNLKTCKQLTEITNDKQVVNNYFIFYNIESNINY